MKPKLLLILALVLSGGLVGCQSVTTSSQLAGERKQMAGIYQDKSQPMSERVAAFNRLLNTFKPGTPVSLMDKYLPWPVADTESRITENEPYFSLHLNAPDGSDRWVTVKGEFPETQIVAF